MESYIISILSMSRGVLKGQGAAFRVSDGVIDLKETKQERKILNPNFRF